MSTMLQIPAADMYVLVSWPAVQLLMRHEWFDMECVAYQPCKLQQPNPSAYFVPLVRLLEQPDPVQN